MKKYISAEKCKDGYVVVITTSIPVSHISDVQNIVRYEGLEIKKLGSVVFERGKHKGEYQRVWAE